MTDGTGAIVVLTGLAALGAGLAYGGWLPPTPTLSRTVARLRRTETDPRRGALIRIAARADRSPGLLPTAAQLRSIGRTTEEHVFLLAAATVAGCVLPGAVLAVFVALGLLGAGWTLPTVAALGGAVVGPLLVHTRTVEHAARVSTDLRHQTSAFLDVVTMLLAGNSGYEGALEQAARAGDGRLFVELRRRVRESGARGASLTDAVRRTGADLGIAELEQVAATAALSATEGAPIARTLAAKCATLRAALAAEQESEARLRTSRLSTPIVGMALVFMGLVIYPALSFS